MGNGRTAKGRCEVMELLNKLNACQDAKLWAAGKTLSQAWQVSAKGETVYRCQEVKATVNKSGTSISFKVVK